jgi:uncharacterized protein YjiS (DUF1127 family)
MQSNQKATSPIARGVAPSASRDILARTRVALANSARSLQTRQRVERELNLLSDRALADLGLFRSDIREFSRNAGRIPGAESLTSALSADFKALLEGRSSLATLWRTSTAG